jgi:ABC-type transporter lipoprotein component MlaA
MFAEIRHAREMLASFQQLDYYDDLMAQYSSMETKSEAGDSSNFSLKDYAHQYTQMRDTYLQAAKALKMASGPYKASRDAYVAAGACLAMGEWVAVVRGLRAFTGQRACSEM